MKPLKRIPLLVATVTMASVATLSASITILGDYTKDTDGEETFTEVFGTTFNYTSGNVYVTMNVMFSNPTGSGILDTSQSYGGYSHSVNDLFGQLWERNTIGVAYYGERNIEGVGEIELGEWYTLVIKYELNDEGWEEGDTDTVKFWVNPVLGTGTEGTPNDADPSRLWKEPGSSIGSDQMRFRRGNDSDNVLTFTDVTIYADGDSPFDVIPEPSATLLGGLGLLALLSRRKREFAG